MRQTTPVIHFFCTVFLLGIVGFNEPRVVNCQGDDGNKKSSPDEAIHGIRGAIVPLNESSFINLRTTKEQLLDLGEDLFLRETTIASADDIVRPLFARAACDRLDRLEGLEEIKHSHAEGSLQRSILFTDCMDALERAQQSVRNQFGKRTCTPGEKDLIHAMWNVEGERTTLAKSALLGLLSMVRSYRHGCVHLKVWVVNEKSRRAIESELGKFLKTDSFTVERLDFDNLIDRIAHQYPDLEPSIAATRHHLVELNDGVESMDLAEFSNVVRLLVLSAYGGVYLDCNMMLLNPLTPLLSQDFYYQGIDRHIDTSLIHLRLGSPNAHAIMQWIFEDTSYGWENRLRQKLSPARFGNSVMEVTESMELLPSAYFEPLGVVETRYVDAAIAATGRYGVSNCGHSFYARVSPIDDIQEDPIPNFFPGVFAFHFENQWNTPFVPGSTADLLLDEYKHMEEE